MRTNLKLALCAAVAASAWAATPSIDMARLSLHFEPNQGQTQSPVRYMARTPSGVLFLTDTETVWSKAGGALRMRFKGSAAAKSWRAEEKLAGHSSYFSPDRHVVSVPHFSRVRAEEVYPGIDVAYYSKGHELEYDFLVAPGADPSKIRLTFEGTEKVYIDRDGNLVLETRFGDLKMQRPLAFQGEKPVASSYAMAADGSVGLKLGRYDRSRELRIDPVVPSLAFSTLLGGNGEDIAHGIALDAAGNAYVAGRTTSTDFPAAGFGTRGGTDAFVAQINSAGTALNFAAFIAGNGTDIARAVAIDNFLNIYVAGDTTSTVFPTSSPSQGSAGGAGDSFLVKLNSNATALGYSTFFGGNGLEADTNLAVNRNTGEAFIAGSTRSTNLPVTSPLKAALTGQIEGFVAKFNSAGARVFSTYWGGAALQPNNTHEGVNIKAIAVDTAGNPVFTGSAGAVLPTTPGAAVPTVSSNEGKGFVAKLSANGQTVLLATYTRGLAVFPTAIAVDSANRIYIAGNYLLSYNDSDDPGRPLTQDVFYGVLNAGGTQWTTLGALVGTAASDSAYGLSLSGPEPMMYISGTAGSADFPTTTTNGPVGSSDVFLAKVNPLTNTLEYSARFGSSTQDIGHAVAVSAAGNPYMTGYTVGSTGAGKFPTTAGALRGNGVGYEGFLLKLNETPCTTSFSQPSFTAGVGGGDGSVTVTTNCYWVPTTSTPWITITSGATNGNGVATFTVQANNTGAARTGTIALAGQNFQVNQEGASGCNVTLNSTSTTVSGFGAITVVPLTATQSTCAVSAISNASWIKVFVLGTYVQLTVDTNLSTNPRTGTVTVAGQTYTVNQGGNNCTYTLSSNGSAFGFNGNLQGLAVQLTTSAPNCGWVTSSPVSWAQVSPQTGTGSGNLFITIAPNFSTQQRTTTLSLAGRDYAVSQTASTESQNHRFVRLMYFSFFGRVASDAEVAFQVNSLTSGQQTRAQMVTAFMDTPEFNNGARYVAGLYVGLLDRDAEHGGWQFQRNALASNLVTRLSLAANFIGGGEYAGRFGTPNNAEYVRLLYRYVLLREASQTEVDFHVGTLSPTFTRAHMATNFLQSTEFRTGTGPRLIAFLISAGLQLRDPTPEERAARIAQLNGGATVGSLAEAAFQTGSFQALLN